MISIVKQPQSYSPVYTPQVFQLTSDNANIIYFKCNVVDAVTNNIIASQRYFTLPSYTQGTVFDLSSLLSGLVDSQLVPGALIVEPKNIYQGYYLQITEAITSGNTVITGATASTTNYTVWNGTLNRVQYQNYDYNKYLFNTGYTGSTVFLSNKPNYTTLNCNSREYLYGFISGFTGTAVFRLYDSQSLLLGTYTQDFPTGITAFRIDVSPDSIETNFGVSLSGVSYYSIAINDGTVQKSELKIYKYLAGYKNQIPIEILFANKIGGFDSFTFFNPQETIDVNKTSINTYPFKFNSSGVYSNEDNNVFNLDTEVINVAITSTFSVVSGVLTDTLGRYLTELIESPKVYVKVLTGEFLPIQITTTNYKILQKRYSTSNNRLSINFTIDSNADILVEETSTAYLPPNTCPTPTVTVFNGADTYSFGYVEPDSNGNATI